MKKIIILLLLISFFSGLLTAQEDEGGMELQKSQLSQEAQEELTSQNSQNAQASQDSQKIAHTHFVPSAGFQALQIEEKDFVFTPSAGLQFVRSKNRLVESKHPDLIAVGINYSQNYCTTGLGPQRIKQIHGCSLMGSLANKKDSFVGMLASSGEVPFSHIKTVTGALLYTHQFIKSEHVTFTLGGGLVVGDFGINIKGYDLYFFALPVFNFSYSNNIFTTSISLMGPPSVSLTLFPKAMFRVKASAGLAGFKSIRDLTFDCALVYYPLTFASEGMKELLTISAGVTNKHASYILKNNTKYSLQYYSVYGEVNASLVTVRCGYNFDGRKFINLQPDGEMYKGLFASLSAIYMF